MSDMPRATGTVLDAVGHVGIWTSSLDRVPSSEAVEHAARLERLGFSTLWIPESIGRDPFVNATRLLAATERLVVATGIANIYARDAVTMANTQRTLEEAFPGRFLLGLGVSHLHLVDGLRHHEYRRPYSRMVEYLDAMDAAVFRAVGPKDRPPTVLAALGPKMLQLAGERADGAHPYFVPPEHTAAARETMGPHALLAPEQMVVLEPDPATAREIARRAMAIYLEMPNYVGNLLRLGFTEDDVTGGGSDRLVDAIVAWGNHDAVATRVRAHHDAGADHVAVQVLPRDPRLPPVDGWDELASALGTQS